MFPVEYLAQILQSFNWLALIDYLNKPFYVLFWIFFVNGGFLLFTLVLLWCVYKIYADTVYGMAMAKAKKISLNIVTIFKNMFISPEKKYYLVFFIINLALMVYQMSFTLFLNERFGIAGETSGYFMALIGLVMVIL